MTSGTGPASGRAGRVAGTVLTGADGRTAELCRSATGVTLLLTDPRGATPYGELSLRDALTLSAGRPWRLRTGTAEDWSLTATTAGARVGCRLGPLGVELDLAYDAHGLLAMTVAWRNESGERLDDLAVGLVLDPGLPPDARITVPHLVYNDNPSADPARAVPRVGAGDDGGFVGEEDRLPVPGVNLEWVVAGEPRYLSLLTRPTAQRDEAGAVRYGSLGVVRRDGAPAIAVLSGVLLFAGRPDVRYVSKAETAATTDGYRSLEPGAVLTSRCLLDWGRTERPGLGFRHLVRTARRVFTEPGRRPLSLDEIVRLKTSALDGRWHAGADGARGYTKFSVAEGNGPDKPAHFLYGWTGQCLKLAWCDARLGIESGDRARLDRCREAVDFYVRGSGTAVPGLRMSSYLIDEGRWDTFRRDGRAMVSSRAYGENLADLADIVRLFGAHGEPVPADWTACLEEAAGFLRHGLLAAGTFPVGWRLDGQPVSELLSAAGISCVVAILKTYRVTGDPSYLADAEEWTARYQRQHAATFDRPFAHAALDAACEDKEACLYYFVVCAELFEVTGEQRYAEWAAVAADWLLTFVYVWSPELDAGSQLDRAGFSAVGWPGVSVQNHHLDAFFPASELMAFGVAAGRPEYAAAADTAIHAIGQTICTRPGQWRFSVVGEQGEAVFQTHWQRRGTANTWNPSWVIAQVLSDALRIRAAGHG